MGYHSLLDPAAVLVVTSIVVSFTPANSLWRIACLPLLGTLTWHCVVNCPIYIARSAWASAVGGYTISSFLHYLDVAVLSGWCFDAGGPSRDPVKMARVAVATDSLNSKNLNLRGSAGRKSQTRSPRVSSIFDRFKFGLAVFFSWRFVNTSHQARNLSQLDPKLRTSRTRFLVHTAFTILVCYLLLDIMDSSSDAEVSAKFYTRHKVSFFSRISKVSLEELFMRLFAAPGLCKGLVPFQRGVCSIAAFLCVAARLSYPGDWPPFNGPLTETYNLRCFWSGWHHSSTFWHQTNTHRLNAMSSFLLHDVLRLPRGTKPVRYLRIWMIFLISGLMHVAIDFASGIPLGSSGAMKFFSIQPLGVAIEDTFLSIYRYMLPQSTAHQPARLWQRCVGWVWLGLWMAWTAPAYLYPVMPQEGSEENGGVVPVSVLGYFKGIMG
ncbi:membrane bound O-acyl transferase family-domain-containing protein [Apiospora aurea]|uniref:Membrane bound O-acyl transferase family-domain-containing protein n=1 Tax=Apiospora aurea TaxID=335848 RepID=A0ABR1QPL5_9PEZI